MAWNEPGNGKRDPWKSSNKNTPPDMEEMLKRLKESFRRLTGGGSFPGGNAITLVLGIVIAWALLDSWTIIDARQVGVVLRFGEFSRTIQNGLNLKWPNPVEQVIKVETTKVRSTEQQVRMLTQDENLILIDFNVQYQVTNAQDFLFNLKDPDETLKQATESAVRQVIGANEMDKILSGQGSTLVADTKKIIQQTLESYKSGIIVTEVNFKGVAPPADVQDAFDDVNKARENRQQKENEAQAYANKVIPEARGEAASIKAQAEGYKAERVAFAKGDTQRFNLIAAQYKTAPEVTRKRLYLETLQKVLANSTKVIDQSAGKNLIYLPLDKLNISSPALSASGILGTEERTDGRMKSQGGQQ